MMALGHHASRAFVAALAACASLTVSVAARAQDAAPPGDAKPAASATAGPDATAPAAAAPAGDGFKEDQFTSYYYVGLKYGDIVIPKGILNLFADGGRTVNVPLVGPELVIHKNRFEYDFSVMYASYAMDATMFKGDSDAEDSYEIVSSSLKGFYFTFDLRYDLVDFDDVGKYSLLLGGGLGFAPVFGDLHRNQAYPLDPNHVDPNDVSQWRPCNAPNNPKVTSKASGAPFCDNANNHYNGYSEPSWANGGSKPNIVPWFSIPEVSFRARPTKLLQMRADIGLSTGFYFALSAAYRL